MQSRVVDVLQQAEDNKLDPEQLVALALNLDYAEEAEFEDAKADERTSQSADMRLGDLAATQPASALKQSLMLPTAPPQSDMLAKSCFALLRTDKGAPDFPVDDNYSSRITVTLNSNFGTRSSADVELDCDGDDLTNLSWLQNANLLQQINSAPPVHTDYNSMAHHSESPVQTPCVLLGDGDVQASNFVTVGDTEDMKCGDLNAEEAQEAAYDKPPFSLNALIFMAIESSALKCMPVRDIYDWITRQFPYYRRAPCGWKNSIRHTLSLGRCFKRFIVDFSDDSGASADSKLHSALSKGSLWTVDAEQRPALVQSLHRTLWELQRSVRCHRSNLHLPSAYLAPLLDSPLFAPGCTKHDLQAAEEETERRIVTQMTQLRQDLHPLHSVIEERVLTSPVNVTPIKTEPCEPTNDADMNAVHALVALKSAATATLAARTHNFLAEFQTESDLKCQMAMNSKACKRGRRTKESKGPGWVLPPHGDHEYVAKGVAAANQRNTWQPYCSNGAAQQAAKTGASDAESIAVPSLHNAGGTAEEELSSAGSDSLFSSESSSPNESPRKAVLRSPAFRLVREPRGLAAQCIVFSSPSVHSVDVDERSASDRSGCCYMRRVGVRMTRSAARNAPANGRQTADAEQKRKRKHKSVINTSWREYRRILSRRRTTLTEQKGRAKGKPKTK